MKKNKKSINFLDETYKFLNNIKNKILEINNIKYKQIDGVIANENTILDLFKKNKQINRIPISDNTYEEECLLINEEKFDKNLMNYKNDFFKLEKFDDKKDCLICFKKIKKEFKTKCNHKFCFKCGNKWIKIKKSCPVCRDTIFY